MFKDCTIKYNARDGKNVSIQVIYPEHDPVNKPTERIVLSVPLNPDNRHYQDIQQWVEEGNTIQESD